MALSISQNKQQIIDAYKQHLGRAPQDQEIQNWVNHVNTQGGSIETVQKGLENHPLARQKKNIQPIQDAYTDYLGRKANAAELAGWTDHAQKQGLSTSDIIRDIALNPASDDYRRGLRADNETLTTDLGTARDERDVAIGERDTARDERDTARNERDTFRGERDSARTERDFYEDESSRYQTQAADNFTRYENAVRDGARTEVALRGELDDTNQRLGVYTSMDSNRELAGLRGGATSGGSNQSSYFGGGSLSSGGGRRSSAVSRARGHRSSGRGGGAQSSLASGGSRW